MNSGSCELCRNDGGAVIHRDGLCRIVLVDDPNYPGYCRVIANRHVREMTDLTSGERAALMRVIYAVEETLRAVLRPEKINLASLGNVTPHLHWHLIPRRSDDRHFPNPIWGAAVRTDSPPTPPPDLKSRLRDEVARRLTPGFPTSAEGPGSAKQ